MHIVAADWLPYTLPFHTPWHTSQGVLHERRGRLLRLTTVDGRAGWGDAAPLPEFGIDGEAATAFAEETAHLDLVAQSEGLPLAQFLGGDGAGTVVTGNANFGPISQATPAGLTAAAADGFAVVKCKVGVAPLTDEIAQVNALGKALPEGMRLRLDANRAWCAADALRFISACQGLPIDGLEEPLAEPSAAGLAALQSLADFPLAIDESIQLLDASFFRHPSVRRIVLKPARHGGLLASMELALRARASGVEVVITSALESACGVLACAHLAAAVAPEMAHGLATSGCFLRDTGQQATFSGARLTLPTGPGLGFTPFGA